MRRLRLSPLLPGLLFAATACAPSTLDLGRDRPADERSPSSPPPGTSPDDPPLPPDGSAHSSSWEWVNPAPQGNRIRGIGGSAEDDVWLVGDGNTVLHWDGERWTDRHGSLRGLDLYSVWSSGPSDVWVAGDAGVTYRRNDPYAQTYSRRLNAGGGAVLHFDGTAWKRDPQIGSRWAHAIWGADARHVFALLEKGDVGRFDGATWTITAAPANAVLRDVWGTSPTNVWAVGDGGTIAHFDGASWKTLARGSGDPKTDPAAPANAYYGLWGASASDVWAVFVDPTSKRSLPASCEQSIGFAHWDGGAWTVAQTLLTPCSALEQVAPQTSEPSRLGHQLWGGDGKRALAMSYRSFDVLAYDGATWSWDAELSWDGHDAGGSGPWNAGIRTVWGRPGFGSLFAAGEGGGMYRVDLHAPPGQQLSDVFPSFRKSIRSLVASANQSWAIAGHDRHDSSLSDVGGDLVRWTTGGWSRADVHVEIDGEPCEVAVTSLSTGGDDDLWISGGYSLDCAAPGPTQRAPVLMHWDGAGWTVASLPEPEAAPYWPQGASPISVWVPRGSKAPWLLQRGRFESGARIVSPALYRLAGGAWTKLALPDDFQPMVIGGSGDDDVWVAASRKASEGGDSVYVTFHLRGGVLEPAAQLSGVRWTDILAASPGDVWLRASPQHYGMRSTTYHWDGKTRTDLSDLNADVLWPVGDGKAYVLSHDDDGANFFVPVDTRFELGFWNGTSKAHLGETSARVTSLVGTKDALWVAGDAGATLRYPLASSPR